MRSTAKRRIRLLFLVASLVVSGYVASVVYAPPKKVGYWTLPGAAVIDRVPRDSDLTRWTNPVSGDIAQYDDRYTFRLPDVIPPQGWATLIMRLNPGEWLGAGDSWDRVYGPDHIIVDDVVTPHLRYYTDGDFFEIYMG